MQSLSRVTNSFVMTAGLLVVIIGSLCFSVGEGLRLTPFTNTTLSETRESGSVLDVQENDVALSKYGPLDVPAPGHKRGKRGSVDLASNSRAENELVFTSIANIVDYETSGLHCSPHIKHPSGRAPPVNS